ncbi:MAG: YcxB family protein [Candidatus Methylumidiphilus sp.]
MTEIEYEVREQDLVAYEEFQLQSVERVQKVIRRHQATVPAIIAVIALLLFFVFKDIPSAGYAIVLCVIWGTGVPFFLRWSMRKQIRQMYSAADKAKILGRWTLRAEAHALVEVGADGKTSQFPWKQILRMETEKKHLFVYVGLKEALIVPIATVSKTSNLGEFVRAVNEHIEKNG